MLQNGSDQFIKILIRAKWNFRNISIIMENSWWNGPQRSTTCRVCVSHRLSEFISCRLVVIYDSEFTLRPVGRDSFIHSWTRMRLSDSTPHTLCIHCCGFVMIKILIPWHVCVILTKTIKWLHWLSYTAIQRKFRTRYHYGIVDIKTYWDKFLQEHGRIKQSRFIEIYTPKSTHQKSGAKYRS